jgi:hypothetical protein
MMAERQKAIEEQENSFRAQAVDAENKESNIDRRFL